MSASRLVLLVALCLGSLAPLAHAEPAFGKADQPAYASWYSPGLDGDLVGVPTNGVLVLEASFQSGDTIDTVEEALQFVTFDVRDAAGTLLPGTLAYETRARRLVWSGAMPFEASATYSVSVVFDNDAMSEADGSLSTGNRTVLYQVTTGTQLLEPLGEVMVAGRETFAAQACAEDEWPSYAPRVELTLEPLLAAEHADYLVLGGSIQGADGALLAERCTGLSPTTLECQFEQRAEAPYCYRIEARSLADGSVTMLEQCAPASEAKSDPTFGGDCLREIDGEGGCSVIGTRGGAGTGPLAWLAALALCGAGLVLRARRT